MSSITSPIGQKHQLTKTMNIPLLRRIQAEIKANPEKFDISAWYRVDETEQPFSQYAEACEMQTACGTTGCIAGWAIFLDAPHARVHSNLNYLWNDLTESAGETVENLAARLLDLTWRQKQALFFFASWPSDLQAGYWSSGVKNQALRACLVIDEFIACDGDWGVRLAQKKAIQNSIDLASFPPYEL